MVVALGDIVLICGNDVVVAGNVTRNNIVVAKYRPCMATAPTQYVWPSAAM